MDPKPQDTAHLGSADEDPQAKAQAIAAALLVGVDDTAAGQADERSWPGYPLASEERPHSGLPDATGAADGAYLTTGTDWGYATESSPLGRPSGADSLGRDGIDLTSTLPPPDFPITDPLVGGLQDPDQGLDDDLGLVALPATAPATDSSQGTADEPRESRGRRRRHRSHRDTGPSSPASEPGVEAASRKEPRPRKPASEPVSALTGWKVAAGFLTAIAVFLAGWAAYQTAALSDAEAAAGSAGAKAVAQVGQLETRVSNLETTSAQLTNDVEALQTQISGASAASGQAIANGKAAYQKVQQSLSVAEQTYQDALTKSKQLAQLYAADLAAAKASAADQAAQRKSLESQLALAKNCSILLAGAMQKVYTAPSPADAMPEAAEQLATVAPECKFILE